VNIRSREGEDPTSAAIQSGRDPKRFALAV
jgi:hypothetical protein